MRGFMAHAYPIVFETFEASDENNTSPGARQRRERACEEDEVSGGKQKTALSARREP
jgi:hypothetical protein